MLTARQFCTGLPNIFRFMLAPDVKREDGSRKAWSGLRRVSTLVLRRIDQVRVSWLNSVLAALLRSEPVGIEKLSNP